MPNNENIQKPIKLSESQMESIKQAVLNSVLDILPSLIKDLAPKIMESAEKIIKENLDDFMPPALETLQLTSPTAKDQARSFEELNKQKFNNKLKYRNQVFWKLTRDNELSNLYSDCLKQSPPYVPRKFRGDNTFKGSEEEVAIYQKLAEQRLSAEIEVLNIRGEKNREKITKIDEETFQFFESKESHAVVQELKDKWQENAKIDEGNVIKKWTKKIVEEKVIFDKETSSQTTENQQNTSQAQTSNQAPSSRSANPTTYTPVRRQRQDFLSTRPRFQHHHSQQHHQGSVNPKNFNSPFPRPPPLIPLNSSTFRPTSWHNVMSPY